jgi:hypothetical protein
MCETCASKGFVLCEGGVVPCPRCNPDSGYEPGEYQAEIVAQKGRCDSGIGGGGRRCYREVGHKGQHFYQCGA